MCDPISIGLGATAAGSLVSGVSGFMANQANSKALQVAADNRLEKAKFDSAQAARKYDRTRGQAFASAGKTGLSMGSFSDVFADAAVEGALEQKAIFYNAKLDSDFLKFQSKGKKTEAYFSLLGGALGAIGAGAKGYAKSLEMGGGTNYSRPWETTVNYQGGMSERI